MRYLIFFLFLLCSAITANAVETVYVNGLFGKKAAVLLIDGKQHIVKVGEAVQGVTLKAIENDQALLEFNGVEHRIGMTAKQAGEFKGPVVKEVRLQRQEGGHYWANGSINNRAVRFVVDTGASNITLNLSTAKQLGIDYENGQKALLATANGDVVARILNVDKVTIGSISLYQVKTVVTLDDSLPFPLLGNSFLSQIDMRTEDGVLILEADN